MSATAARAPLPIERPKDRTFYTGMAVAVIATIYCGFARSYFLRGRYFSTPLAPIAKLHGAVFLSWVVLFVVQTRIWTAYVIAGRLGSVVRVADIHSKLKFRQPQSLRQRISVGLIQQLRWITRYSTTRSDRIGMKPDGGKMPARLGTLKSTRASLRKARSCCRPGPLPTRISHTRTLQSYQSSRLSTGDEKSFPSYFLHGS